MASSGGDPGASHTVALEEKAEYYELLLSRSTKLFSKEKLHIGFGTRDENGLTWSNILNHHDLDSVLQQPLTKGQDNIICLYQKNTWAPFFCSFDIFQRLMERYLIHPAWTECMLSFGQRHTPKYDDAFAGVITAVNSVGSAKPGPRDFDFIYTVMYIERSGRSNYPWSVRRMGVYHKFCSEDKASTWLILQPSPAAEKLVQCADNRAFSIPTHVSVLCSTLRQWRWYLLDLDASLKDASEVARLCHDDNSKPDPSHGDFTVAVAHLQQIQYILEQLQDALLYLDATSEILDSLQRLWSFLNEATPAPDGAPPIDVYHGLARCASSIRGYKRWTERSIQRAESLSHLIRTLLAYRQDESLTRNTSAMAKIAECSIADSASMLLLSQDSKRDSETMKLIAIITMIYLPATFVATLFSTEFIGLAVHRDTRGSARTLGLAFSGLTAILTILTFLGAFLWQRERFKGLKQGLPNSKGRI